MYFHHEYWWYKTCLITNVLKHNFYIEERFIILAVKTNSRMPSYCMYFLLDLITIINQNVENSEKGNTVRWKKQWLSFVENFFNYGNMAVKKWYQNQPFNFKISQFWERWKLRPQKRKSTMLWVRPTCISRYFSLKKVQIY